MNWYITVLKRYATFRGRSRRSEYWFFTLFNVLISFGLAFIDGMVGSFDANSGVGMLSGFYTLAIIIPSIAVAVRRLHDTERTGWWLLLLLIPLIGPLVILFFMVSNGNSGANEYGDDPKELTA
ncbi:DUF805 domain-containing protein [Thalassotalea crassostreae]|uniref:DUF805 domain-containing protein n=1 Tax=Thalassotalea crassostreae TaxID=1763536 RepID=UPI000838C4AD|nr:DUF805 domain-containing protein [Thalassotalea crassostreae]